MVSRDELRERIWGNETFVDFNHGLSAAVNRLRDALGDSADNPRYVETVARRGYCFIAPVEGTPTPVSPAFVESPPATEPIKPSLPAEPIAGSGARFPSRVLWTAVTALTAAGIAGLGLWLALTRSAGPPPRLEQVTSLSGSETMPTFSPDGAQIAFVWNGEKESNADIYVKLLGSESALRLTNDTGADLLPSWSPDGRNIAFVRIHGATGIYLVSPLGGPERRLLEFSGLDRRPPGPETRIVGDLLYPIVNRPSWSADGKFLAVAKRSEPPEPGDGSVLLVPLDGGEQRTLLAARSGTWYSHPTFSPEGRRLAVSVCHGVNGGRQQCKLQIVNLTSQLQPQGEPRTILSDCKNLRGVAWMPNGESLIVSGFNLPHYYAWRVSAGKEEQPARIELAGAEALWPTVSPTSGRLAFTRSILQADLWRLELGGQPAPFLSSTARDTFPQFSPDGRRIAFQSARGGENEIWLAGADGTGLVQITRNAGEDKASPRWSPDGQSLAFHSTGKDGRRDVWIVEASGGLPRQLTREQGDNGGPSWSGTGKSVYFSSDRSGRNEIWRLPTAGGAAEQITRRGGHTALESMDGKALYYTKRGDGAEGLYSLTLSGGNETLVFPDPIIRTAFDVVHDGIYYVTPRDENLCDIRFHEFATARSRVIAVIERPVAFGLSVSPDRKTFLFSRPVTGSDLMMVENFR